MRFSAFALLIIATATSSYGAEWYENLPPGVTRVEILQTAGHPSSTQSQKKTYQGQPVEYPAQIDRYDLREGYIELTYDNDVLIDCSRYSKQGESQRNYYIHARSLSPVQMQVRREYLKAQQYTLLPKFDWNFIRTNKYRGAECYQVDDSFLIIEPILVWGGGGGFFADKTAEVTLLDAERHETVLYRAIDNWQNLRPPQLDDEKLKGRTKLIAALEKQDSGTKIKREILGPPDSSMGSGIPYVVYYLKDSLAIGVDWGEICFVSIARPGESYKSLRNKCFQ